MKPPTHPLTIGVVGVGYVGLVTAGAAAHLGHRVICLDVNEQRVAALQRGELPIYEPGLNELIDTNRDRLTFTNTAADLYAAATVVFVCVDTPPSPSGDADLSRVESVIAAIPPTVTDLVLAIKSTVPVGTGRRVRRALDAAGLRHVAYCSNPEFLREGSAVADVLQPDRVVVGSDERGAAELVASIWAPLGGEEVVCDVASAEMVKLAANAFLATRISFINEVANVCDLVDADVNVVARGMGLDRRIGMHFLSPGIGYGGSCFPKDVVALRQLAANLGYQFQIIAATEQVNELQKRRVVGITRDRLGSLAGARVALLGLAFKPGTDDTREAPSVVIAQRLSADGATIVVYDPVVRPDQIAGRLPAATEFASSIADAITNADAVIIVTEWPEFRVLLEPGLAERTRRPLLVDGRNLLDPAAAAEIGWEWVGTGRPSFPAFSFDESPVGAER